MHIYDLILKHLKHTFSPRRQKNGPTWLLVHAAN